VTVTWLWAAVAAAFGAAAISYVQLVGDRATQSGALSRLWTRSRCPRCDTDLSARDVLPILGFLLLRGRCRSCHAVIPRRHLLAEIATAVWWAASVVLLGAVWWLPPWLMLPCLAAVATSSVARGAGRRWWVAALLPPGGVAALTLGIGAAVNGRWLLYGGCAVVGASALLATAAITRDASRTNAASRT
jgi:leader peptidase (prepilin peptidase)/N-methyltransferase